MASAELPAALETAARIRTDAPTDSRTLRSFKWQLVEALTPATAQSGESGDNARAIQKLLRDAIAIPGRTLSDELATAENSLITLVVGKPPTPKPENRGEKVLTNAEDVSSLVQDLTDAVTKENKTIHVHWWVE